MNRASELVGASPPFAVRPVSLAVRNYLRESQPDAVVLAVSGGADSLALAVCALEQAERLHIPVRAVTVDHGMRSESAVEAAQVCQFLRSLGADALVMTANDLTRECASESGSISKCVNASASEPASKPANKQLDKSRRRQSSLEARARNLRWKLLGQAAADFAQDLAESQLMRKTSAQPVRIEILTGHTQNDQAETMLLSLARGVSLLGLTGMRAKTFLPAEFVPTIPLLPTEILVGRPLLKISRAQTEACCQALNLQPVLDPTNRVDGPWRTASGEPLPRAALRECVLPELSKALGQDVVPILARLADRLHFDEQALSKIADQEFERLLEVLSQQMASANDFKETESPLTETLLTETMLAETVNSNDSTNSHNSKKSTSALPVIARLPIAEYACLEPAIRIRVLQRFVSDATSLDSGQVHGSQLQAIDALACNWHGQGAVCLPGNFLVKRTKLADNISVLELTKKVTSN